ncbi:MAG: zinc ABC transporter substrate-binding protein [Desulfovibrio sp.]|jgi:zinc transport system substrate-binding protein|nr:zinc ABC transporter substrate-binding protein [Desulfovibrio sp.]
MRKAFTILCAVLVGCAFPAFALAGALQVAVGVAPVEFLARKIGGGLVQTTVLVPAGADAHTYEPKPSQMRAIAGASLYLSTGLEFEEAWEGRLKGANKKMLFVHTDDGLKKLPMPEGHDDHQSARGKHGQADEMDPHIWVSPANMRQMAAKVAAAFAKADPANAKAYAANLAAMHKEIDALDAELKGLFAGIPAARRSFLVFHPAWGYFARDYGLTQMAIEFEGKEPSPRRLAAVVGQAKAKGARAVFVQPQMSQRTAGTVAQAVGGRLVVADPLAPDWDANLRKVAKGFREALQ